MSDKLVIDETIVVSVMGLIYTVTAYKITEYIMDGDINSDIQMMMFLLYTFGFMAIYVALTYFKNKKYIKNGLLIGGTIIIAHSTCFYWNKFDKMSQYVVAGLTFCALCWMIYDYNRNNSSDDFEALTEEDENTEYMENVENTDSDDASENSDESEYAEEDKNITETEETEE